MQLLSICHRKGRLGLVLFQFPTNFFPNADSKRYLRYIRATLLPEFRLVVEFRCLSWFRPDTLPATKALLTELGIALAATDELAHELNPGQFRQKCVAAFCGAPAAHACGGAG